MLDRLNSICARVLGRHEEKPEPNVQGEHPRFIVRIGTRTSIGNYRDNNEDRFHVDGRTGVYLVADGMGGQAAGEQASQIAVDIIPRRLLELSPDTASINDVRKAITEAVLFANNMILARGSADPSVQNMGTTVVMAVQRGNRLYVAHVGDSRAYKLRDGKIEAITTDHNLAQALYEAKTISKDELRTHRFRHVLWKYLGSKEASDGPDINEFEAHAGDRVVLASDGLTSVMEDDVLRDAVYRHTDPQKCAEDLVRLSLENGSKDNVTCIVLFFEKAQ